ncbi:MAG: hypothetical protein WD826_03345 [Actinomycetota bacterium]
MPSVLVARFAIGLGAADFSGFDIAAKTSAALFVFDSPSLGIPAKPTGEFNFGFSEAKLESGPSGYGLASVAWPGQVTAALPGFIAGEINVNCQCEVPFTLPNYPVRAETFHPQGPATASQSAGTMVMRSSAKESYVEAVSYLNAFDFPVIGSLGNQSTLASTGFDPDGVVSMAESAVTDVSILDAVTFDSVVTRATARSDGVKGRVAGTTTITGATVAGTPVIIDTNGVRVAEQGIGGAAAQQAINGVLSQLGMTIELSAPVDTVEGPSATRALGGVLIRMRSSVIEPLIAALPEDIQKQLRGQITFDQEIAIQLAPAVVRASAARAIAFEPPADIPVAPVDPSAPTDLPTDVAGGSTAGDTGSTGGGDLSGGGIDLTTDNPTVVTRFEGVPLWLVILLMLASFVLSRPLSGVADRVLAAKGAGAACPEEA